MLVKEGVCVCEKGQNGTQNRGERAEGDEESCCCCCGDLHYSPAHPEQGLRTSGPGQT